MSRSSIAVLLATALLAGCSSPPPPRAPDPPPADPLPTGPASRKVFENTLPRKDGVTIDVRMEWYRLLQWPAACEESFARAMSTEHPEAGAMQFRPLGDQRWLVRVGCAGGVYQQSEVYVLLDESTSPPTSALLRFPTFSTQDGQVLREDGPTLWGAETWDPAKREITVVTRAPNGCGTQASYRLQGTRVVLWQLRAKVKCDGRATEPATWVQLVP